MEEISSRFDNLRVPVSANEREKGTTPYYGANGIQDYVKGFTHNGEYVLIAEDGANDLKNYPVKYVNGLFWANNHVHVVQGKEGICDNKYLKYCFTKTNIESLLVGGGRAKLNANIMMGIDLTVPSFNEQIELGRLFYEIDNLITLHQRKFNDILVYKLSTKFLFLKFAKNVWEQRKFIDFGTISMCKRIFKDETSENGDIPFYKIGTFGDKADAFISNEKYEFYKLKFSYPNKGDILLSASGTIGRIVEYKGEKAYFQDSNIVWLNHNDKIKNSFLKVLYPTVKWDGIEGSTIKRLYNSNFLNTEIMVPDTKEQDKIGELFTNLDNLITLHHRKYTYIFYSWEQRKVTDIGKLSIGLVTTMTSHYTDKGTLLIRNSDIKDNCFEFSDEPIYLDEEFANKNANRKHEIGDVITVHTGDVGTSAVIDKNTDKSIGFATIITRPNLKIIDSYYLSTFLNTEKHKKWAVSISTGDGRTNYNLGDYQKLVVPLTSVDEQRKIANFILNLDNLITLHQHKELKRRNDNNEHLRW